LVTTLHKPGAQEDRMPTPNRLIMSTPVAQLFAPFAPATARAPRSTSALRADLRAAMPAARPIGVVRVKSLRLSLPVYRARLQGRDYDVVVRRSGRAERVIGLVPLGGPARRDLVAPTEHEATILALELLGAETEAELDLFLGKIFKKVANVASGVMNTVKKVTSPISKALDVVNRFVPIKSVLSLTPAGLAMRAAQGLQQVARGGNVFKIAGNMLKSGVKDVGNVLSAASSVASFIPGVGTGVAAALGAAGALAQGKPITDALIAAARSAIPGGAVAQAAFDVASGLVKGQNLSEAALSAARKQLPGGPAAQAAFDAAVALAQGKKLQQVAMATAGRFVPAGAPRRAAALAGAALA
jgi:hypothetical protein